MSRPKSIPGYRLHKQSGQAYVCINGRQHLLGTFDSPESKSKYGRLIAEWHTQANARDARTRFAPQRHLSITRMLAAFWEHAQAYYVMPDGTLSRELTCFSYVIRLMRHLYGDTSAADFGPKALKALREAMIRPLTWTYPDSQKEHVHTAWCRTYANHQIHRARGIFKWAVSEELIPGSVYTELLSVAALARGRTTARESTPVTPVTRAMVQHVLEFLPKPVRAIVELEEIAGARGGELSRISHSLPEKFLREG